MDFNEIPQFPKSNASLSISFRDLLSWVAKQVKDDNLNLLPDFQREALILGGAGGMRYEEVAEIMGCPVGTVKSRVRRARDELQAILFEGRGAEAERGGAALARLWNIDPSGFDRAWSCVAVRVACDVTNPLTGPLGASAVYGPQKGAGPDMVRELDAALARLS